MIESPRSLRVPFRRPDVFKMSSDKAAQRVAMFKRWTKKGGVLLIGFEQFTNLASGKRYSLCRLRYPLILFLVACAWADSVGGRVVSVGNRLTFCLLVISVSSSKHASLFERALLRTPDLVVIDEVPIGRS